MALPLGNLAAQTTANAPGSGSLDQGISAVIANSPTLRSNLTAGTFGDMSAATRQLVAESAATQLGDKSLVGSDAGQRFIAGDFSGANNTTPGAPTAPVSPTNPGTTPTGAPSPSTPGSSGSDLINLITQRYAATNTTPLTEQQIQDQEIAKVQDQINAIQQIYGNQIASVNAEGGRQVGRTKALNNVGGTAYSPFGESNIAQVNDNTQKQVGAVRAEEAQAEAAVLGHANDQATARFADQAKSLAQNTNDFISHLTAAYGLSDSEAQQVQDNALKIAQLTGYYNGSPTADTKNTDFNQNLALKEYLQSVEKQAADQKTNDAQLAIAQKQAEQAGYQTVQLADGTIGYYDYSNGAPKFVALGNYAKAPATSGGGGSSSGGGSRGSGAAAGLTGGSGAGGLLVPSDLSKGDLGLYAEVERGDTKFASLSAAELKTYNRVAAAVANQTALDQQAQNPTPTQSVAAPTPVDPGSALINRAVGTGLLNLSPSGAAPLTRDSSNNLDPFASGLLSRY